MTETKVPSAHLLLAPPGGGKTTFCMQRIQAVLQETPFAPVWVIVRDRLQADAYRAALAGLKISLGVEVATFSDLYREILQRSGLGLPVAENAALSLILRQVLNDLALAGALHHFSQVQALPGFTGILIERFVELKSALVMPAQLEVVARERNDPALIEIALIYAAYQQRLQSLEWADTAGLSWLGLEALQSSPGLLRDWRLVVVDGFDSFTLAQRRTVQALSEQVPELWVTLPGEPALQRSAHRRFTKAFRALQAGLDFAIVSPPARSDLPAAIAALEARLFEPPLEPKCSSDAVQLLEARQPQEEIREALRWLKARIVRDGLAPSDCALILPEDATYRPALLATAAEFGLPLRLTHAGRLADTPPMAALADLLALPLRNFPSRPFLDTLRSPFFDLTAFGLQRQDARLLELVCRRRQIVEGLAQWQAALADLANVGDEAEVDLDSPAVEPKPDPANSIEDPGEEDEPLSPPALPKGRRAVALWQGLETFSARITPPVEAQSLEAWARWLADLLESVQFHTCCTSRVEAAWLAALDQQLGAMAAGERLAGRQTCHYAAFLSALLGMLAAAGAAEDLPESDSALWVLHPFDARGLRFQAVALVGLAEGIFPAVERADPFFNEAVRAELGMEPRLGQDQAGIFYQLVTRADQKLLVTRPYLAKDGENWDASPFWNAVCEVLHGPVVRVRPEDHRPLADAASQEELMFWAARRQELTGQGLVEPYSVAWQQRYQGLAHAQHVLLQRAEPQDVSAYEGHLVSLASALRERFGGQATWSASRLEGYAACPFFFLASSALGLERMRPPKAGFESVQLGSLLHEVLERLFCACPEPGNVEMLLARLPEAAAQVFASAPARYAFRPTLLWEIQQAELMETLRAAVVGLAELDTDAGWQPESFECRFGIEGTPELWIPVDGQPVRLRGVIDRIDRDRHGNLRVIDYKSGGAHLAQQDLIDGRRLQLPLYALAVESALGQGHVAEGLYWKLFAQGPGGLRLSRFACEQGQGPAAAQALAVQHVERLVMAIRQGNFSPQAPQGGCPSYCPAASWCWSYHPKAVF